ncbi:quinoprotein glucose dehydrogenase [Proteus mirabilis]|uniref:Quinoprotein glucose dehydrogenase n=1 Tax=Proteus mirabilis TaxID=584 RepID=A0A379GH48_PROMI|nr:quinoprotein glucose dehydrogenase [Proteus mirabilis]
MMHKRMWVYIPTGVGTPDIWGGDRHPLKERYANSVLALKGSTGELLWHFQTTHHDFMGYGCSFATITG